MHLYVDTIAGLIAADLHVGHLHSAHGDAYIDLIAASRRDFYVAVVCINGNFGFSAYVVVVDPLLGAKRDLGYGQQKDDTENKMAHTSPPMIQTYKDTER